MCNTWKLRRDQKYHLYNLKINSRSHRECQGLWVNIHLLIGDPPENQQELAIYIYALHNFRQQSRDSD